MVRLEQRGNLIRVANYLSLLAQLADDIGDVIAYEEWDSEAACIAHTLGYAGGFNPFDPRRTGMLHRQFEKGVSDRVWYESFAE